MANYSIVSNARFTPFSFEEMVKPFQMYGEYYAQQEQLASSLAEEAAEWGQKANETTDPITYQKYKSFEADLNRQSERLLRQGLTPGLRADLQKMKKRYATEINPIKDAYNWKLLQIQQQAEGKARGVVYERDAATTSLDDYIANPTLIHSSADSNAGYTRIANAAQAVARGLSEAKISNKLDNYTKALLIRSGYDVNDVTNAVNQAMSDLEGVLNGNVSLNSRAGKIVQELLQNESRASGIGDWKNISAKQEYFSKVSPALYNLIGQSATSPMEDFKARTDLQGSWQSRHIHEQGVETRRNQSHAAALSEAAAEKAHKRNLEILGARNANNRSSNGKSGGSKQAYDRPNMFFSKGKQNRIAYSSTDDTYMLDDKTKLTDSKWLKVVPAKNNRSTIEFYYGNQKVASYNTSRTGKNSDMIEYYNYNTQRMNTGHGGVEIPNGVLKGVTATDIRRLARLITENPGSENQYWYGVANEGLFSIQNNVRATTKDINASANAMQDLWDELFVPNPNYGGYGQDSDLNPW